ncbi:epoxide hydrolase [Penicillium argentinense]|uniref:Epoxide hydrolase n=1 Tax=Penicillium argentinense TaxID=1131581 RepID=A0A9W9KB17_9EURO|nr:epoxide hydrolase [Penicillium argentinense]KAJ5099674.1 epoxide hydrolase [Penicillium argentinense]
MDLNFLKALRREWVTGFNWETEQDSMNRFNYYKTPIEDLSIHFVFEKSAAPNAIPLLLVNGLPGSSLEFAPIINQLTKEATASLGKSVSFDVIIPSLPGFAFSSPPPLNWTITDTARILNTMMVDILGYEIYAIHGMDWGSAVSYNMYDKFNETIGVTPGELATGNLTLSEAEQVEEQNVMNWANTGNGYFIEQTTKASKIHIVVN